MKILYACFFFLNMLAIAGLGFTLFHEMDSAGAVWEQLVLAVALGLAIALLVLLIRGYVRGGDGSNDK
jgi:hypothetical protein